MTGKRIFEVEDCIREEYLKQIKAKKWVWGDSVILQALCDLIGVTNVIPFTIKQTQYGSTEEFIIKSRGSGTELIKIVCLLEKDSDWQVHDVKDVNVTILSKIIENCNSLIDYLQDRVKKLEVQFEKKANEFTALLKEHEMNEGEFFKMMRTYNNLDSSTRTYLCGKANL